MKPPSFMLVAGEASGDMLAAELVSALRAKVLEVDSEPTDDAQPLRTELAPTFFGAGGPRMAAAGVGLAFDMTQHSVIGISDVLKNYFKFRRLFNQLLKLAIERQPDVIIGVDYGGLNLRFAHAIRQYVRSHQKEFVPWNPRIVQFVSPQVWASRPARAYQMAEDHDLLLSIFPFEKDWYAKRVPKLRVEFVGHPMVERFNWEGRVPRDPKIGDSGTRGTRPSEIVLLPGSRKSELQRHLPVMLGALKLIQEKSPAVKVKLVLPGKQLAQLAASLGTPANVGVQIGDLPQALSQTDVAIASTGTVTMECAFFGLPTVTLYKTSWSTYQIARRIVSVKWLTMPNILANEEVFPEFVQGAATPENISRAALDLLKDETRRQMLKAKLLKVIASLGGPGANARAAEAIVSLIR